MYDPNFLDELAKQIARRLFEELRGVSPLVGSNRPKMPPNGNRGSSGYDGAPMTKRLLTVNEAAKYLGRPSPGSIYHLVNRRQIPVVRQGRVIRFDVRELDRWIAEPTKPVTKRKGSRVRAQEVAR